MKSLVAALIGGLLLVGNAHAQTWDYRNLNRPLLEYQQYPMFITITCEHAWVGDGHRGPVIFKGNFEWWLSLEPWGWIEQRMTSEQVMGLLRYVKILENHGEDWLQFSLGAHSHMEVKIQMAGFSAAFPQFAAACEAL